MDLSEVLAALAVVACVAVLIGGSGRRSAVYLPELAGMGLVVGALGFFYGLPALHWTAVALTSIGVVLPLQLFTWAGRRAARGDYPGAAALAWRLARFRPGAGDWARAWSAVAEHHDGRPETAQVLRAEMLARGDEGGDFMAEVLCGLTRDWAKGRSAKSADLEMRSLLELGELQLGVEVAARLWRPRMSWAATDRARANMLAAFAFSGRAEAVDALLSQLRMPEQNRRYWRAVTAQAAGEDASEALRSIVESPRTTAALRRVARQRIETPVPVGSLDEAGEAVLAAAQAEIGAGALLRVVAPWRRPAVVLLLLSILAVFGVQLVSGGATNEAAARRLGAVLTGEALEFWRLFAYGWLHYGWIHLGVNLFGLALVAPIAERALGWPRWVFIYLAAVLTGGVGIMLFSATGGLAVGASAGLMGTVAAALVIAWRHPGARGTRTGQAAVRGALGLVAFQFLFDLLMPQVSLAGHLSGAVGGGLATWLTLRSAS